MFSRFVSLMTAVFLLAVAAQAQWNIQTIDNSGNAGSGTDIAYDASGNPHVVYLAGQTVKYTHWTGSGWAPIQQLAAANGPWNVYSCSVFVSDDGQVHAAGTLQYQYYTHYHRAWYTNITTGSSWTYDYWTQESGQYGWDSWTSCTLVVGPAPWHEPHVIFQDYDYNPTTYRLVDRWYDHSAAQWVVSTIDGANDVGSYCNAAISGNGDIHVAYYDRGGTSLKYARRVGTTWSVQYVDEMGDVGSYCNIAVDGSNVPHISYYDATNHLLKYATIQ